VASRKKHLLVSEKKQTVKHYGRKSVFFVGCPVLLAFTRRVLGGLCSWLYALRSYASYPPAIMGIRNTSALSGTKVVSK